MSAGPDRPSSRREVDPALTEPHLSARTFAGLRKYVDEAVSPGTFDTAVEAAGLPAAYLADMEHWVSAGYSEALSLALGRHLSPQSRPETAGYDAPVWQHWRLAGKLAVERDVFGPLLVLTRALGSPGAAFKGMSSVVTHANKMARFSLDLQARGLTVMTVAALPDGPPDRPEYCWSRRGVFESIPTIWGLPEAEVEHRHCVHQGQDACRYVIRYRERPLSSVIRTATFGAALGAVGAGLATVLGLPAAVLGGLAGVLGGLGLEGWNGRRAAIVARQHDALILGETLEESERAVSRLHAESEHLHRLLLANQKISGYLNPDVVEEIMQRPERALTLGGRTVHAAVLFLDIVGYTTRSEGRDPADVVAELNAFFGVVDPVLDEHSGVLDKRIGDAIMAVFVDRDGKPPAEARALACALDILRTTETFNAEMTTTVAPLKIRIGVSAGNIVQGNIGSPLRYEYTVIGDIVNLAARLEEAATPGHVLTLAELASHLPARAEITGRSTMPIRGREAPAETMELLPR